MKYSVVKTLLIGLAVLVCGVFVLVCLNPQVMPVWASSILDDSENSKTLKKIEVLELLISEEQDKRKPDLGYLESLHKQLRERRSELR